MVLRLAGCFGWRLWLLSKHARVLSRRPTRYRLTSCGGGGGRYRRLYTSTTTTAAATVIAAVATALRTHCYHRRRPDTGIHARTHNRPCTRRANIHAHLAAWSQTRTLCTHAQEGVPIFCLPRWFTPRRHRPYHHQSSPVCMCVCVCA